MAYISNMVDRAIALLAGQFQGTDQQGNLTNLQKLVTSFVLSGQEVQNVIQQLRTQRNIDNAVGVQLDGLGQILGLPRNDGESDDSYRQRLRYQTFINSSTGTPEEVIKILSFLTNGDQIGYIEFYPGAFQMSTNGLTFPDYPNDLIEVIQDASPASVQYIPVTATYNVEKPFVFASDAELELLYITDPNSPEDLTNLELDTGDLLYINPFLKFKTNIGGGFAEFGIVIDTQAAGQLAEVIQINGAVAPAP